MLVTFCEHQDIPKAPFFLRNLGLEPKQWLKQDTSKYKKDYIEHILEVYDQMAFVLIGDSGQRDPEIYADICKKNPEQIKAVYIRHVYTDERREQLKQMAEKMQIPLIVTENSQEVIKHIAEINLLQ